MPRRRGTPSGIHSVYVTPTCNSPAAVEGAYSTFRICPAPRAVPANPIMPRRKHTNGMSVGRSLACDFARWITHSVLKFMLWLPRRLTSNFTLDYRTPLMYDFTCLPYCSHRLRGENHDPLTRTFGSREPRDE